MDCFMCSTENGSLKKLQTDMDIEILKKISFVLPDLTIPETKDPICICAPCIEQVTYFYTIKKACLQNCCHLKHFKAMLNVTNKMEFNELHIQIKSNEVPAQHKYSEFKVNPNHKNLLSSEDENPTHIKEETQEYDDYSQQLVNNELSLNYLQDNESSSSSHDSTQYDKNVGSFEFLDVNKSTETDDEPKTQRGSQQSSDDDNAFTKRSHIKNHPGDNTEERPFNCSTCHKTFKRRSLLHRHKLIHVGEKPHECDVCHKTFSRKSDLSRHKLIHTGEKLHECDVCNKTFYRKCHLIYHKRTHNNVRPFQCAVCNKAFSQSGNLSIHMLTHTGKKPHQCRVCQYKCAQAGNLKKHICFRSGKKPYSCNHCEKSFTTTSYLKIHKHRRHNDDESN